MFSSLLHSFFNLVLYYVLLLLFLDGQILNSMLRWVTAGKDRAGLVGTEIVQRLSSLVGQAQSDACHFCGSGTLKKIFY
jgi:hypothetical protein